MKIGIYGHSKAVYKKRSYIHYSERVNAHFTEHQINWYGTNCSSIERLVYSVQKHTSDLYIIFHTAPYYVYCPQWSRDFPSDTLFKQSYRHILEETCKNEGIELNLADVDGYKKFYNEKRDLNHTAYLFLMKGLLVGKNVIHVVMHGQQEKRIFKGDYFSDRIANVVHTDKGYLDDDVVSKAFIHEIESKVKT